MSEITAFEAMPQGPDTVAIRQSRDCLRSGLGCGQFGGALVHPPVRVASGESGFFASQVLVQKDFPDSPP